MIAYLDGKSFDHLYKKIGCTGADIANLRKRIYGRELSIPLSVHHLEELMLDRQARPELRVARVKLMLSIGNFRRMAKPCAQMITEAMWARVSGEAARPLIGADVQNLVSEGLSDLIESDGEELNEDLMALLEESRGQREQFVSGFRETIAEIARGTAGESSVSGYTDSYAPVIIERLARNARIATTLATEYQAELAQSRSLRAYIVAAEEYSVKLRLGAAVSDYTGIVHAISAAEIAEVLVSADGALRAALGERLAPLAMLDLPAFLRHTA